MNIGWRLQPIFPPPFPTVIAMPRLVSPTYLTCQTQLVRTGDQCDYSKHTNLGCYKIRCNYIYHYYY